MNVDNDLFMYNLAVVAIMKNEAPYLKEWMDYHILAGVDHFYIYDNDSPDNQREILQPYINTGIVTYKFLPGLRQQMTAYNDAVKNYKFFCRYMAFIDGDELILPRNNKNIVETVDEILLSNPNAAALSICWIFYGSNYQEKADYSRGVLERFTRRSDSTSERLKVIANPRKIYCIVDPHNPSYFFDSYAVTESGKPVYKSYTDSPSSEKIVINHYKVKSAEEYAVKNRRGDVAFGQDNRYILNESFHKVNNNVFDDSIIKYRDSRKGRGG